MKNIIINDWKEAFKSKNLIKKSALEAVKAKILLAEKSGQYELPLKNDIIVNIIAKEIKEMQDSMQYYKKDSIEYLKFIDKIRVLEGYLPQQLNADEVKEIIKNIIITTGETNMGKLIGLTVKQVGNSFDKSKISGLVREIIC